MSWSSGANTSFCFGTSGVALELQEAVGRLDAELSTREGESFAGLWIQHKFRYHITAQFTLGGV